MGLLMSDTLLIDPLLDETVWSRDAVGAWAYALDATDGGDQHETADLRYLSPSNMGCSSPLVHIDTV